MYEEKQNKKVGIKEEKYSTYLYQSIEEKNVKLNVEEENETL